MNATATRPPLSFCLSSDSGRVCDLSQLLADGAKLTVLFTALCRDWGISTREKWAYHRLRRQLKRWAESGLIDYLPYAINSCSVEIDERPGVFCRARAAPNIEPPYLIKRLQNSKSVAPPQFGLISEPNPDKPLPKADWLPGGKISWYRIQAIRKLQKIRDPALFIRRKENGVSKLNPELRTVQKQISKMFEVWKRDVSRKNIIMRDTSAGGRYLVLDYKTRFTDTGRHWQNEKTYRRAINKSLELYNDALFITLTSDPQIHMRPKGEQFTRHVNDPQTGKTYEFTLTGQGGSLWSANRNESKAFRKWYERMVHRFGGERLPYIRVVEFQKNGLIHTHLLLFGINGEYEDKQGKHLFDWETLARDWGERYGQGLMNQVYRVKNVGGVWEWAHKGEQPDDTHGRTPADYLGKYLKKASDIPTIKCECGEICSSPTGEDIKCPKCGAVHKAPADGRYLYWVMGKRFFTVSQVLREYDFDREIEREDLKRLQTSVWEFVGSPEIGQTRAYIERHARKLFIMPLISGDGWEVKPKPIPAGPPTRTIRRHRENYRFDDIRDWDESPDINDDSPREIIQSLHNPQAAAVVEVTTAEEEYRRLLELEREERKRKREELKRRKELKT